MRPPEKDSDGAPPEPLDRRRFLARTASALLAIHGTPAWSEASEQRREGDPTVQILDLRLQTAASLDALEDFYHRVLGLDLLERGDGSLTVAAGTSRLTFTSTREASPFYHFAFNIPENKLPAARRWQLERTELIAPWEHLRDPEHPDDVVWFRHWNAHSVFFFDPAGNVLEHIARHDLPNRAAGEFSTRDILCLSEIGLITDDVPAVAREIERVFGAHQYRQGSDAFTAMGDENGLLLVMRRGRMLGFGQGSPAGVFPTAVDIRATRRGTWTAPRLPYRVSSRSPASAR